MLYTKIFIFMFLYGICFILWLLLFCFWLEGGVRNWFLASLHWRPVQLPGVMVAISHPFFMLRTDISISFKVWNSSQGYLLLELLGWFQLIDALILLHWSRVMVVTLWLEVRNILKIKSLITFRQIWISLERNQLEPTNPFQFLAFSV